MIEIQLNLITVPRVNWTTVTSAKPRTKRKVDTITSGTEKGKMGIMEWRIPQESVENGVIGI